jgi:very-short-patch-repair endonuclease
MRRAGEMRLAPTPAETKLWSRLRAHHLNGVGFRRQHAIGHYITDFCEPSKMLVIELDGSQHQQQRKYDTERTAYIQSKGYRVLRFYNNDVMNHIDSVLAVILDNLKN